MDYIPSFLQIHRVWTYVGMEGGCVCVGVTQLEHGSVI